MANLVHLPCGRRHGPAPKAGERDDHASVLGTERHNPDYKIHRIELVSE